MGNLTARGIDTAKKKKSPYKLIDGDGLQLRVATDGAKTWLVRYFVNNAEGQYTLPKPYGTSGAGFMSLFDARHKAAEIRALGRSGRDYQLQQAEENKATETRRAIETAENLTVQNLFDAWLETTTRKDDGAELRRSFGRDVLPLMAAKPLKTLVESDMTALLRAVVQRGSNRAAVMLLNNLKQMFKWAEGRRPWKLLIQDNPVMNLKSDTFTAKDYTGEGRDRNLSESEIGELLDKLPGSGLAESVLCLVRIMLACCTRIGETVKAEWKHVNLENGEWFIPGANTKNGADHTVYLSAYSVATFETLKALPLKSDWCFPATDGKRPIDPKAVTKMIRDRQRAVSKKKPMSKRSAQTGALLLAGGDWVPHDLRRTGATMLQSLGVTPEVIERVLNHKEQDKLKKIYHQYDYAKEKREAWRLLGDRLEVVRQIPTTTPKRKRAAAIQSHQ